ncbi:MAG: hypothetical protein JWQ71_1572 [Pedosphaera sp.]|nr:hypothetical protein [Pedosphaera sp.]
MKQAIEKLFVTANNFDLVDGLFSVIADKEKATGLSSLSAPQRTILTLWHTHGIIGNGSFEYFFECGLDAEQTAQALEIIGFNQAATYLRLAVDLFPDSQPNEDYDMRQGQLEAINKEFPTAINDLSTKYWAETEPLIETRLADFARSHRDAFDDL